MHKTSRRCWPHTEAIKAEVAAAETGDGQAAARAAQTIDRLLGAFLGRPVAGGWIDHVDATGAPIVDSMPASTLYHVFLAAAEADRVWGEQGRLGKKTAESAMSGAAIRQAVILAGGKGTRLGAITRDHSEADAADRGRPAVPRLSARDDRTPRLSRHPPARRLSRRGS